MKLENIHPGEILKKDFLDPLEKSNYWLAKGTGLHPTAIGEIIAGKRAITPHTALCLGRFLGTTAQVWLNLQTSYDLEKAEESLAFHLLLQSIVPVDWEEETRAWERKKASEEERENAQDGLRENSSSLPSNSGDAGNAVGS